MTDTPHKLTTKDWLAYGLFYSWNLIFLAFMTLGFAPRILPELVLGVATAAVPASFLLYALVLTAVPIAAILLGLTLLRRAPKRLFALGYVVEGPLMLLLAVRFFLIREATPGLTLILLIAGLGIAAFLWYLLEPSIEKRSSLAGNMRLLGLTLMLLVSLYAAVWIAFYAVPLATAALQFVVETLAGLPQFLSNLTADLVGLFRESLIWVPFALLGFLLLLYTATLFVLTPIVVPILSAKAWWQTLSSMIRRRGRLRPALLVVLVLAACAILFFMANQQPQHQAFALLETPPTSMAEAQSLLGKQNSIRTGLLNAYLAPFRYMSAVGEVVHVRMIYQDIFDMTESRAAAIQDMYETVASPLLYDPVHSLKSASRQDNVAFQREPQEAARLYQRFFDQTIVEGERQEIVHAVRNTWSQDQAEAAWQAVDDVEIYLVRQEVQVQEHGDWAEVELLEVYQNQTSDRQEVIYYFNLPESAVLTGVWLGNSPDRAMRFAYQVAPRGAAQAVYRNETLQLKDPALLEQIGPRQYRLRVFPVLPVLITWDENRSHTTVEDAPPLYLWLTYQTLAAEQGWPMPNLAVKRNVFWDDDTERLVNGSPMVVDGEAWLPEMVSTVEPITPRAHHVDLPGGQSVLAEPVSQVDLPQLPTGLRLAVVLDRSRSMTDHTDQVTVELARLQELAGPDAEVDVYLTASPYRGESPSRVSLADLDLDNILYFGGQNAAQLLAQFEDLRSGHAYDAVLVLTDGSGYELGENEIEVPIPAAPVWLVHLSSDLPLGYDDETLEAIQASGGGVVGELEEALTRLAVSLAPEGGTSGAGLVSRDLVDGYMWTVLPADQAEALPVDANPEEQGFTPFAARRFILAEMQRNRGALDQLDTLDYLHELAQEYSIVTPYSSMIVLVSAEQERILDHLAQEASRFKREYEEIKDTTPATQTPLSGVPEPHEWLLIGLAVLMLLWYASRRRIVWQRR